MFPSNGDLSLHKPTQPQHLLQTLLDSTTQGGQYKVVDDCTLLEGLIMLDLRHQTIFIASRDGSFEDKTHDIDRYQVDQANETILIQYSSGGKQYRFSKQRVYISPIESYSQPSSDKLVLVDGRLIEQATQILAYSGPTQRWNRIFYRDHNGKERNVAAPERSVRLVETFKQPPVGGVIKYWESIVASLPEKDPLHLNVPLPTIHPESALAYYAHKTPPSPNQWSNPIIYPFNSNLSQRQAVENALKNTLSVIQGPPGTGKATSASTYYSGYSQNSTALSTS